MAKKKQFKCVHCGRIFSSMGVHKCNGSIRTKGFKFVDRNNIVWEQVTEWKQKGNLKWSDI